jgi:hypothetical protein
MTLGGTWLPVTHGPMDVAAGAGGGQAWPWWSDLRISCRERHIQALSDFGI